MFCLKLLSFGCVPQQKSTNTTVLMIVLLSFSPSPLDPYMFYIPTKLNWSFPTQDWRTPMFTSTPFPQDALPCTPPFLPSPPGNVLTFMKTLPMLHLLCKACLSASAWWRAQHSLLPRTHAITFVSLLSMSAQYLLYVHLNMFS